MAGDILGSSVTEVAEALRPIATQKLRVTDEVEIYGEDFELSIYPSQPGRFLIGGNLHHGREESRGIIRKIAALFDQHDIVYLLELSPEDGGPDEITKHRRFDSHGPTPEAAELQTKSNAPDSIGERLQSGSADEVRSGVWHGQAALLTFTGAHVLPHDDLRESLTLRFEGITPLLYCGYCGPNPSAPYPDMLVEALPAGSPLSDVAPLGELVASRIGATLATIGAAVHAAGARIDGLRPELVYVDDSGVLTGLVPRGPAFISSAPITRGMRSYRVPFMSPEQLLASTASASSDVFSLCATIWFAATKLHPFGDPQDISGIAARLATGQPSTWPGEPALGALLLRGLSTEPSSRPSMAELAAAFAGLAARA